MESIELVASPFPCRNARYAPPQDTAEDSVVEILIFIMLVLIFIAIAPADLVSDVAGLIAFLVVLAVKIVLWAMAVSVVLFLLIALFA